MNALLHIGLSNAAVCGIMTVVLIPVARRLRNPALTHALCVLILLKLLTPPLFNVPVLRDAAPAATPSPQAIDAKATALAGPSASSPASADATNDHLPGPADDAPIRSTPRLTRIASVPTPSPAAPRPAWFGGIRKIVAGRWRYWLPICWIGSAVLLGAIMLGRLVRFGFAVRRATVPGPDIAPQVGRLAARLGIRRPPPVRFIAGSAPPMLLAVGRHLELVIPARLWVRLDHAQQQTLLLHELAHLRRGDHRIRYLELLATCLYWWHPATWLARAALHEAEEQCCDAWVVWAMPDASRTYMTTILDAIEFLSLRVRPGPAATPVLASGMGQFHNLQRRLAMVREQTVQRRLNGRGLAAVAVLAAVALPLGATVRGADGPAPQGQDVASQPNASSSLPDGQALAAPGGLAVTSQVEPGDDVQQPDRGQGAQSQEIARLEAQLQAARKSVESYRRQLNGARTQARQQRNNSNTDSAETVSPNQLPASALAGTRSQPRTATSWRDADRSASLGGMFFTYEPDSGGTVQAYDGLTRGLVWTLKAPLDADSVIRCFDNDTLLIKSADGYTRLVNPDDGRVTQAWPPGADAPPAHKGHTVNPFGLRNTRPRSAQTSSSSSSPRATPSADPQDQERRLERIEENLRLLTEAVNRLTRQQNERGSSSETRNQQKM